MIANPNIHQNVFTCHSDSLESLCSFLRSAFLSISDVSKSVFNSFSFSLPNLVIEYVSPSWFSVTKFKFSSSVIPFRKICHPNFSYAISYISLKLKLLFSKTKFKNLSIFSSFIFSVFRFSKLRHNLFICEAF